MFQQPRLLYWKEIKPNEASEAAFQAGNYVLVANVYDDFIWVNWNSRPKSKDSGDRSQPRTSPQLQESYAIFPGTEGPMAFIIIYAKIADS